MRKWHLALVSLAVLTLGLAACGKSSSSGSNSNTVEIQNDKGEKANWKNVAAAIKADTGITTKMVDTQDTTAYTTNIKQSLSSSNPSDMFTWWNGSQLADLAKTGNLYDLSSEWNYFVKKGLSPQLKNAMSYNGKVYGVPLYMIYNTVFYNTHIFAKYHLQEPKTMDQFMNNCAVLKKNGVTPIGIGMTWQSFVWPMILMGSYEPEAYDQLIAGKIGFDDPRVKSVMYKWADMLQKGYFTKQQQDQGKDFANGKNAMMVNGNNWDQGLVDDYGMKLGKDVNTFIMPSAKNGAKRTIFYEVAPFLVSKNGNTKAAVKALKGFYSKKAQESFAKATGTSALPNVKVDDVLTRKAMKAANDKTNYQLKPRYYEQFTPDIVNQSIDEYWKIAAKPTKAQVDTSMAKIQKAWEAVKKD